MFNAISPRARVLAWCFLTVFLLAWNGAAAYYASPLTLLQEHDGAQYHLLVRNRLRGHYQVGDLAHTVRDEGQHPIWRPGLVWIEEGLARCLGSVRAGAAVASALSATLVELAVLWLAGVCFGTAALLLVFGSLLLPLLSSAYFLRMAVGQGPEPWAAAALTAGLACLVRALQRQSWRWALAAGVVAGLSEWFRAGSYLVFLVPCLAYGLSALSLRQGKSARLSAAALASFVGMVFVSGLLVASPVNKTVVAFTHRFQEKDGRQLPVHPEGENVFVVYLGGLQLSPNPAETNDDYAVRQAHGVSTVAFFRENQEKILAIYFAGLEEVAANGARALREMLGNVILALFAAGVLLSLARRQGPDGYALALAAGALVHYLGPIVLLRGDLFNQYLLVILPLFVVVAGYGALRVGELLVSVYLRLRPPADPARPFSRGLLLPWLLAPACYAVMFYQAALGCLEESYQKARAEVTSLAALDLGGRKVACRTMAWFADVDVQAVLLPYATVPELARYARANGADGILLWERPEPRFTYFKAFPYPDPDSFHQALADSGLFGPARVSGHWRWYPLRQPKYAGAGP